MHGLNGKETRYFDTIRRQLLGTEHDYDQKIRQLNANTLKELEEKKKATNAAESTPTTGANSMSIMKRPATVNVNMNNFSLDGIWDYYEEFDDFGIEINHLEASAGVVESGRVKKPGRPRKQSSRDTLKDRIDKESRMPQALSQRAAGQRREQQAAARKDVADNMQVDAEDEDDVQSQTQRAESVAPDDGVGENTEEEETPAAPKEGKKKIPIGTTPLKTTKGTRLIQKCMEKPDPAAAYRHLFMMENKHHYELLKMAAAIVEEIDSNLNLKAALTGTHKRVEAIVGETLPVADRIVGPGGLFDIEANLSQLDIPALIRQGIIIASPRLKVTFKGNYGTIDQVGIFDSGAEACCMPEAMAKELGVAIQNVENIRLSTANNQFSQLVGMSWVEVAIQPGFSAMVPFFLLNPGNKVLLGQPFCHLFRYVPIHHKDGSAEGKFFHPKINGSSCIVKTVPKLKARCENLYRPSPVVEDAESEDDEVFPSGNERAAP